MKGMSTLISTNLLSLSEFITSEMLGFGLVSLMFVFERERRRAREGEGQRERATENLRQVQVGSWQYRARHGALNHQL